MALTVRDKDGEGETQHLLITVREDSLSLRALPTGDGAEPDTTVTAGEVVQFGLFAHACGFDTDAGNYENRFLFRWDMGNVRTRSSPDTRRGSLTAPTDAGLRHAIVTVTDDQFSVTRRDTVTVQVNWSADHASGLRLCPVGRARPAGAALFFCLQARRRAGPAPVSADGALERRISCRSAPR